MMIITMMCADILVSVVTPILVSLLAAGAVAVLIGLFIR